MGWMERLEEVAGTWRPDPVVSTDVVSPEAPGRFAALLDQPNPVIRNGDPLPPLWHWFLHLPVHPQANLGADGHPRSGALLPPLPDGRRRMFGGGRLQVHAPLLCGDAVTRSDTVTAVRATMGNSGPLLLVTVDVTLAVAGEVRVAEEQHIVYLPPVAPAAPHGHHDPLPVLATTDPSVPEAWSLTLVTDPVLLFRFSALTANAHRIHYDRHFAQQVEGHRDLVVHGPLSALLLLEVPRRQAGDRDVTRFQWQARRPAFVGERLLVTGHRDADELRLDLRAGSTERSVTGIAMLAPTRDRVSS